jgi:hypothetical protein
MLGACFGLIHAGKPAMQMCSSPPILFTH